MSAYTLTSNDLADGLVVYLDAISTTHNTIWRRDLDAIKAFDTEDLAEEFLASAIANCPNARINLVGPYAIAIAQDGLQQWQPTKYKEIIRMRGPSVALEQNSRTIGIQRNHPNV